MASSNDNKLDMKLDYLEGTKSLIKQALENKGASVTDNTTFREYADLVNNLRIETDQSDATVTANDMVAGKIAYNNNNKVIGNLTEYSSVSSEATEVLDDAETNKITGKYKIDDRLLLGRNANINIDIPYDSIDSYNEANELLDDILGETNI